MSEVGDQKTGSWTGTLFKYKNSQEEIRQYSSDMKSNLVRKSRYIKLSSASFYCTVVKLGREEQVTFESLKCLITSVYVISFVFTGNRSSQMPVFVLTTKYFFYSKLSSQDVFTGFTVTQMFSSTKPLNPLLLKVGKKWHGKPAEKLV